MGIKRYELNEAQWSRIAPLVFSARLGSLNVDRT